MSKENANQAKTLRQIFMLRYLTIGIITFVLMGILYALAWVITVETNNLTKSESESAIVQGAIIDSYAWRAKVSTAIITKNSSLLPGPISPLDFGKEGAETQKLGNDAQLLMNAAVESLKNAMRSNDGASIDAIYRNEFGPAHDKYVSILTNALSGRSQLFQSVKNTFFRTVTFTRITVIFVVLIIVTLLVLAYKYMLRDIINPISHIHHEVEKLTKGNLSLDATVDCKNQELLILGGDLTFAAQELNRYIGAIKLAMDSFKNGDFTIECPIEFLGDFSEIRTSIEDFQGKISSVLARIDETSSQVYTSAEQVSGVSQNLADGAVTQASTVEQLAANINSITEQITQNAENAKQANMLGSKTSEVISHGKDEMNELMQAMQEIEKSSANIGNIINTIDNIAFQTNILALNAAVEAARAGQAGKGFGVVADEVRSLAQKSAEAAKSTTELIEHSLAAVTKGISLANNTHEAFEQVILNSNEVLEVVDKIAIASKEQADSITHFSMGIEQVSSVVQMNSSTSEESAAASQELSNQATHMKKLIEQFKIKRVESAGMDPFREDTGYHTSNLTNYSSNPYSKY